jgi:hypothetical protein
MPIPGPTGPQGPDGPEGGQGPTGAAGAESYATPQPTKTVLGNDTPGGSIDAVPITVHQELDWTGGDSQWKFDGFGTAVQLGDVLNFERTDPVTFSVWVDAEDFSQHNPNFAILFRRVRASDQRGHAWGIEPLTGQVRLHVGVGGSANSLVIDSTTGIPLGRRIHIVTTYNGNSLPTGMEHYFDGVLQGKTTITNGLTNPIAGAGTATISFAGRAWKGSLQHMAVWNSVLSPAQVLELYNGGTPGDLLTHSAAANLRGWWKIEGSPDTTKVGGVIDSSGNGLAGSVVNGLGGRVWKLDGVNDVVTPGDVLGKEFNQAFSLNIWGRTTVASSHFLAKINGSSVSPDARRGYRIFPTIAGTGFTFRFSNNDVTVVNSLRVQTSASPQVLDGLEHMLTVTYDGSGTPAGTLLYVDGVLAAKTTEVGGTNLTATALNADPLYIGGAVGPSSLGGGNAVVRQGSIWGRVLTAGEVAQLYGGLQVAIPPDLTALSFAADLEAWWAVDEDDVPFTAGGVPDRSANGFDGTSNFAPQSAIVPYSLAVRKFDRWGLLLPGATVNRPLVARGPNAEPVWATAALTASAFEQLPANSILINPGVANAQYQVHEVLPNSIVGRFAGVLGSGPAENAHFAAGAAIALSKLETIPSNSVVLNPDPTLALPPTTMVIPVNSVLGTVAGVTVAAPVVADQVANNTLIYQKLAAQTTAAPFSGGGVFEIRFQFVVGTAVDITLLTLPAGIGLRILDVIVRITTAVAASTLVLRTATGGGGSVLSPTFSTAATGYFRNTDTQTRTCAPATLIVLRRSVTGTAGTITIKCCRN